MEDHRNRLPAAPGWYVAKFRIGMEGPNGWPDSLALEPIVNWEIEREQALHA